METKQKAHYELAIVILLALLFGIVLLNRLAIVYLFPFIIPEFKITYAKAGALASILALTWAFATWFFGGVSDRIGRKIIVVPATIFFSLMSWASGITASFVQMFVVRSLMGIGQGAVLPASIATIGAESTPTRRGFNFGVHMAMSTLISIGMGAFVVTQLTKIMTWRMVFFVVGIPGLLIAAILWWYMREPKAIVPEQATGRSEGAEKPGFFAPLRYRNVVISSFVNFLFLCAVYVFVTFAIMYLTKELQLSIARAGIIVSVMGVMGFFGSILLPLLSDYVGRKTVIVPSLFVMGVCFWGFLLSGPNFGLLALWITIGGFAMGGLAPLAVSALPTESVPPHLAATASGIPVSVGEIFGAGLMPFVAGYLCDVYGLKAALYFSAIAPLVAGFFGFLYEETAPRITDKRMRSPMEEAVKP